jgi:hypothetical protein
MWGWYLTTCGRAGMFSTLERLVGAVVDREGTAEFVALSQVVRRYTTTYPYSKNVTESFNRYSYMYYPRAQAKDFPASLEATVQAEFPYVILAYRHEYIGDEEKIIVRAKNKPPAPIGKKVETYTVYINQSAGVQNIKSNASQIVSLLSQGYAYEGDVEVYPDFRNYGDYYPLELVLRDPKQRTWREWASGTNKQPQD